MKKVFKIFLIAVGVLLVLLITLPILFKGKIEKLVKEKVNENIHAVVNWNHFGLNFFRGFPALSLNLKGMSVTGLDQFEGDTLAGFERFEIRVKPFSAVKGDLVVEAVILSRPLIHGVVLGDSSANWDIVPEADSLAMEEVKEEDADKGPMKKGVQLKRFSIIEGRIFYDDAISDMQAGMEGFNLDLTGDFSMDQTDMDLDITIAAVNAKMGGIRYLKDARFEFRIDALADMINSVYTLKENELRLNDLVLGAEGSVSMPNETDMLLDLNFQTRETSFKTLLSMVPAVYMEGFEALKTSGSLQLSGSLKGVMNEERNPDAVINLVVKDGYFGYPDLPSDVSDIQIGLDVNYNGGNEDLSVVDLHTFHLEMAGNPLDVNLHVKTPISDMSINGQAIGVVDFATLADVVPMDDIELGGRLETDITLNTKMSYIENEDYENVDVEGKLIISDVTVNSPDLPAPVDLKKLDMLFNPRFVYLNTLDALVGASDLHMDGKLSNFIPYVFEGKTVAGELNVSSELIDANQFIPEQDTALASNETGEESEAADSIAVVETLPSEAAPPFKIPENIDFKMRVDISRILYDQISIQNLEGNIYVKDGVARLDELKMDILDGEISTRGTVDTREDLAHVDVDLDITGIDIPQSYETFVAVERLAPMAKFCKGSVNTKMRYESFLNDSFEPVYESINARGVFKTKDLQIYNLNSFVKLSELLKNEKFRNMAPDEVHAAFRITDGRVIVDPFDIEFDDSKMKVSGSHGIDMTMDYSIDMAIARKDLGAGANELLSGISALAAGAGLQIPESDYVKVKAHIGGTFDNPDIKTDLSGNLKSSGEVVQEQVKERVEAEVQKKEEEVREKASDEADRIIKEAEEEADRLIKQAEAAGADLVKEAEKQGESLVKEAGSNPLKKLAAQKAAEELVRQAKRQSENLVNEAKLKADEILEQAKEEAERIDN